MATGHQDRSLSIWDIRTQQVLTSVKNDDIQGTKLSQIQFSNKGYQFAATWSNSNAVKIYDMRKNFSSVLLEMPSTSPINISFDAYGNNLMAGQDKTLRVFSSKTWAPFQVDLQTDAAINKCMFNKNSFVGVTMHSNPDCFCEFTVPT